MAALNVKAYFSLFPSLNRIKYILPLHRGESNTLSKGYKHSLAISHNALAKVLVEIPIPPDITLYQYIDDNLIGGDDQESVKDTMKNISETLIELGLVVLESKCQGSAQEVKFLGVGWIKGATSVPMDTLKKIERRQNSSFVKKFWEL